MTLAFLLYKYFPYGGMQRDFMRFLEECQARGHEVRVYYINWQGDMPAGAFQRTAPMGTVIGSPAAFRSVPAIAVRVAPVELVLGLYGTSRVPLLWTDRRLP